MTAVIYSHSHADHYGGVAGVTTAADVAEGRVKVIAPAIGLGLGVVLGMTSVGSGALVAIALMVVFRLTPHRVVGTDVFHAALIIDGHSEISSRASDAIALALRTGSKVLVEPSILDEAAIVVSSEEDDEVERFKEFLDHVSAEDFEGPPGDEPDRGE